VWVPAFPMLYSRFDKRLGHCRRYRRRDLSELFASSGYDVLDVRYINMPGWFMWFLVARVLGRIPNRSDWVAVLDRYAVPLVRAIEPHVRVPFGQSLLMVAQKPLESG